MQPDVPYDTTEEDLLIEIDRLEIEARRAIQAGDDDAGRAYYQAIVQKRIEHRDRFVKVRVPFDWKCPVCSTREITEIGRGWVKCFQGHMSD